MSTRLRKLVISLFVAAVIPLSALSTTSAAYANCPAGTHWDTVTQSCV